MADFDFPATPARPLAQAERAYRAVWRLHFYAGVFCIPFVLWLSVTGAIYLFKPQIDAFIDRNYDHMLVAGAVRALPSAELHAALAAVPGATFNAYELPPNARAAARVLLTRGNDLVRVYVDPRTLSIAKIVKDDDRFENRISRLHGELLLGDRGSMLVELAASWAIVMIGTGLYLWYPRDRRGMAGVLWPRRGTTRRDAAKQLHGVAGTWVSIFALFFLVSGLPWAASWGGLLKTLQDASTKIAVHHDWTTGSASALAVRRAQDAQSADGAMAGMSMPGMRIPLAAAMPDTGAALDRLVPIVVAQRLAYPVLVVPPGARTTRWTARSDAQDRPLRVTLTLDPRSGAIVGRRGFAANSIVDRIVAIGVAGHEGQLFAPINQLLSLVVVIALVVVCVSALTMWWSRRPVGALGAPRSLPAPRFAPIVIGAVAALGLVLPLLGSSLIAVALVERFALRRIPKARRFLGLA